MEYHSNCTLQLLQRYIQIDYFNIFISLLTKYMKQINIKNKMDDKRLRNSIFSIILILAKHESMHKYFERSQIIKIILKYIKFILTDVHIQTNQDFQCLCIIYNIIHRICKCYRVLSIIVHQRFITNTTNTLFNCNNDNKQWTPTQLTHIRLQIIHSFQTLIKIVPKLFFRNKVIDNLFTFFIHHQQSISHYHSINKTVDIVSKSLLRLFSKCLNNIKKKQLSNQIFIDSLQSIINIKDLKHILLEIINHVSFDQVTRTDAVLIISYFAKLHGMTMINRFRNEYSMEIIRDICQLLHTLPSLPYYQQFQTALIKCLRNLLGESSTNQNIFFNQDGISIIFKLVQNSEPVITENSINLLLELSLNEQFSSQIQSYQQQHNLDSDDNMHLQTILFNVWDKCG